MVSPVSLQDLIDRWRPLADGEDTLAQALLDDAWAILLAHVPSIPARLTDQTLNVSLVRFVVTSMVLRVLRNPEGYRQGSRTIDDFTESWTRDNALSAGVLYASPEEIALLRPAGARKHGSSTQLVRTPPYGGREDPYYRGWSDW